MNLDEFKTLFLNIARLNGVDEMCQPEMVEKFKHLTDMMNETNRVMNITAIKDIEDIILLHYVDCMKISPYIGKDSFILDVGCGGGFPTLPLAIVRPDLNIVALDSTEKKIKYVQSASNTLQLKVNAVAERAEILAKSAEFRETFDVVTSRAVARLNILNELCLPFVKIGGKAVIMKGCAGREEFDEAYQGIEVLGGSNPKIYDDVLIKSTSHTEKRTIIEITKNIKTPVQYPRQFGQIKKKPL